MPATFAGVEEALREEESARVLSTLKDPYGDLLPTVAHATTAAVTASDPVLRMRDVALPQEIQSPQMRLMPKNRGGEEKEERAQ